MLRSIIDKYQAYRLRRFLRRWARTRARGKPYFVIGSALFWCLFVAGTYTLVTFYAGERSNGYVVIARFAAAFLFGLLVGHYSWKGNEDLFMISGYQESIDDAEWEREWRAMPHRQIVDHAKLEKLDLFTDDFGPLISATISLAPERYIDKLFFETDLCPICTAPTSASASDRAAASISPQFEELKVGISVWVHPKCFETLPMSDESPPIPC